MPYPDEADKKIREAAAQVGNTDIFQLLDNMKNNLLGNAERVDLIAQFWAQAEPMRDAHRTIQDSSQELSGFWTGPAYNQFSSFNSDTISAIDADQAAMASMGSALGACVSTIYQTYSSVIGLIGKTAADLVDFMGRAVITLIPGIGELEAIDALNSVIDILSNFVRNVTDLITGAVQQFGQYKGTAIGFISSGEAFRQISAPPSQVGNPGSWHVNPAD